MSATKQQIADVFQRHVERFGYAKTTLDEVAREMRISKKTIYVHFDGKREIYRFVVEQQARQERARMAAVLGTIPTRRGQVEALLRFVIGQARAHIAETSRAEWLQEYEVAADAFRTAHGALLQETVAAGIAEGDFAPGDARLVERIVAAMVLDYIVLVNAEPEYDRDEELVERILRFVG